MVKEPLVSLVIPSYNGKDMAVKLLESLKKTRYKNFETVLVDNGSVDGTYEYVKRHYRSVKAVRIEKNRGFAGGMNFGIKHSKGDYIVVMNNDMTVEPNWLAELVKVAESDKTIAIVGAAYTEKDIDFVRLGYNESGGIVLNFKPVDIPKKDAGKLPSLMVVDNTFGLTRKEVLDRVGWFDEKYFIYWEEVDLCYRAKKAGYKVVAVPRAKVFHGGSQTMKKHTYQKTFHYNKNKIRFILKNLGTFRKLINTPLTLLQLIGKSFGYTLKGDFRNSLAIFHAIFWNIKNFADYL